MLNCSSTAVIFPLHLAFTPHPCCLSCPSLHLFKFFVLESERQNYSDYFREGDTSSLCSGVSSLHLEIPSWIHSKVAFVFLTSALH